MQETVSRRGFLIGLVGGILGLTAAISAIPIVRYLIPESGKGGTNILTNADGEPVIADEIKEGASFIGLSQEGPTIVVRRNGRLHALSAVCTHLGCLVKWEPRDSIFFCPCHAGVFDANGVNVSGPPPTPLAVYSVKIDSDRRIVLGKT